MSNWIEPITDRTPADVIYAREHRGNLTPNKGARNKSDFSRIQNNSIFLQDLLKEYGYSIDLKQGTEYDDFPIFFHINENTVRRVIQDMETFGRTFLRLPHINYPSLPINTIDKMNDIEKILLETKNAIGNMAQAFIYCGEIESGEDFI